jgi:heat shock protein HslJ
MINRHLLKGLFLVAIILFNACGTSNTNHKKNNLKGTGWRLAEIVTNNSKEYVPQDVLLDITFAYGKINGRSGCNTYLGNYKQGEDAKINIELGGTTLMICEEHIQKYEDIFVGQIEQVKRMHIDKNMLFLNIDDTNYFVFHRFQKIDNGGLYSNKITTQKNIWVAAHKAECQGVSQNQCFLIKDEKSKDWELFYDAIKGFKWEKGFEYQLLVEETKIDNPPADGSSIQWKLIKIINKQKQ